VRSIAIEVWERSLQPAEVALRSQKLFLRWVW
jgi:hypothetical protein